MNNKKRKLSGYILTFLLTMVMLCTAGCGGSSTLTDAFSSGKVTSKGATDSGYVGVGTVSLRDFDWAFDPRSYDSSGEVEFKNPMDAAGAWEMVIWRRTAKGGAQKDVYLVHIGLEDNNGKMLAGGEAPEDIAAAADFYANQAFKSSEEAQNAGLQGSDTANKLLEALAAGDGSIKAHVTVILAGIEDNEGNWHDVSGEPVQLEGKYFPDAAFIKVEDQKGNQFTANHFLTTGDGKAHHAIGAYTPAGNKQGLHGALFFYRRARAK